MKMFNFALMLALTFTMFSCGKKEGGGGSDSLSSNAYSTQDGTVTVPSNIIKLGGRSYQLTQVSQQGVAVLTQAYNQALQSGIHGLTGGTTVNMYGQPVQSTVYRVRLEAIRSQGFNGAQVLDIRRATFRNYR